MVSEGRWGNNCIRVRNLGVFSVESAFDRRYGYGNWPGEFSGVLEGMLKRGRWVVNLR